MSKERLYGWNGELPVKSMSGQAAIIFRGLQAEPEAMFTGHEWADKLGPSLATRQDPYRVVLYYIVIFKGQGLIRTNEFDINRVTRTSENLKHAITVRTQATVDERYSIVDPKPPVVVEPPVVEEPIDETFWETTSSETSDGTPNA
jgi:hypothetical protein